MREYTKFYINGEWVAPESGKTLDVINPATEKVAGRIALGNQADVDKAVAAAKTAFETFSQTSREERVALLGAIVAEYQKRLPDLAAAITEEMGAPGWLANAAQAPSGLGHFATAMEVLKTYEFEKPHGNAVILREPAGVVGMITPWNWPANQIACKVAPAIAAGCTMVLKPSEVAPFSGYILTEILHAAGVPKGVFNMVNGDGPTVGVALSSHPDIDFVTFTGSTRAGVEVAKNAASTVKRVAQELGGKSANIILEDANLEKAVASGIMQMMNNSGQSCNAPSRMLVDQGRYKDAIKIAAEAVKNVVVGPPDQQGVTIGPVASDVQYNKIQSLIEQGIKEGATVVAGGPGKPEGLETGYYVKPTIFADVNNDMTIAREEIFGPVLVMIPYKDEADAIRIANDTVYGLSGYVQSGDPTHALNVAKRIRTGNVHINGAPPDFTAPFGGYKQSGNGREWGSEGMEEFLETKAVLNPAPAK